MERADSVELDELRESMALDPNDGPQSDLRFGMLISAVLAAGGAKKPPNAWDLFPFTVERPRSDAGGDGRLRASLVASARRGTSGGGEST